MDPLLPQPPLSGGDGPEPLHHQDPLLVLEREHHRWRIRAAQWKARALAEEIFGSDVEVRLGPYPPREGFSGLLHLDVPFESLESHRIREKVFTSCAGRDPVLASVPLLFVFNARRKA